MSYLFVIFLQFKIGRAASNDVRILSVLISRNHCEFNYDSDNQLWTLKNLSSTDTFINNKRLEQNSSYVISENDILQLSLSNLFKYKFTIVPKTIKVAKHPRLEEAENIELDKVLSKQKIFIESQRNERKDLENKLSERHEEQVKLKNDLL